MQTELIGDNWYTGDRLDERAWSDEDLRIKCEAGTNRERQAYLQAGYTLKPSMYPVETPEQHFGCMRDVAVNVCEKYKVTLNQMLGDGKGRNLCAARREAYHICSVKLGKSFPQIGKFFRRDHTTIMYHVRAAEGNPKPRPRGPRPFSPRPNGRMQWDVNLSSGVAAFDQ